MTITATHINYLLICKRKLWLFANGIRMETESDRVYEGKLTGELSYADRAAKYTELVLDGGTIDYYDAKNQIVHEVKQSNKMEKAHIAQVKYYLYLLRESGVANPQGILEYPKLRERQQVLWEEGDRETVEKWLNEVREVVNKDKPDAVIDSKICKSCSYHDFCYSQ